MSRRKQFYEDPAMKEAIHREVHRMVHRRGDQLFGSLGERDARDSFKAGLTAGYFMGLREMYQYFIEMANRRAGDDD
jgi:hypothetical protein